MDIAWELSQSFVSDGQGIRTACVLPNVGDDGMDMFRIVAGTQGGGLCEFGIPSGNMKLIPYQHNHAITALLSSSDSSSDNDGACYYVTGCKDNKIRILDGTSHELIGTLEGHEKPVTSLSWCFDGGKRRFLISGSWDGTAKVWNFADNKPAAASLVATLPNHENSVCVCGLTTTNGGTTIQVATGSAGMAQNNTISGHTVRIWQIDTKTKQAVPLQSVANDHDGPIRDIVLCPTLVATCSNDGTVKLRLTHDGKCESTLSFVNPQQQHPPMLLSLSQVDSGAYVIASSDDGQVIIWNLAEQQTASGSNPHVIPHAQCVWNTLSLPNGDFGTCCQDGILRIFTRSTERYAPQEEREQFTKTVSEALQKSSSGPSSDEISKLPKWEDNAMKQGTSEGQVQLFQKSGKAIAAQWSMASQTWIEVGEVMGTKDTGMIDGVKYDHVLPIEVDQPAESGGGVAKLQIGYNNGENTFVAAQRFIDAYNLPQYHLQQIADYIQQRVGAQTPTIDLGAASAGMSTGGNAPTSATSGIPIASYEYLPTKTYKLFELTQKVVSGPTFDKMKIKIQEFGGDKKLSAEQFQNVATLMETLAGIDQYSSSIIQDSELDVIEYMLQEFPMQESFPALDLARYAILHPNAIVDNGKSRTEYWSRICHKALEFVQTCITDAESTDKATAVAIPMLSFRLFSHAMKIIPTITTPILGTILSLTESYIQSKNKNIRLAVATLLHNISIYLDHNQNTGDSTPSTHIVTICNTALRTRNLYEVEPMMRIIVALGTIVMCPQHNTAKESAKSLYLATQVQVAASAYADPAIKRAAKEVYTVLA